VLQQRPLHARHRAGCGLRALVDAVGAGDEVDIEVAVGTPLLQIIRDMLRNDRDLVIRCAEIIGLVGRFFGSDDMHLLRKCPCPVWLCKPGGDGPYRRILVAVDAEQFYPHDELRTRHALNLLLLELAAALAQADSAELHVAYVWSALGEGVMRGTSLWAPGDNIDAYIAAERQRRARALASLLTELETITAARGESLLVPIRHLRRAPHAPSCRRSPGASGPTW